MYKFVASSIAAPKREREESNQDFFRYQKLDNLYVAVVSDGVSSAPYAQEGAHIACNSFISYIEKSDLSNHTQEIDTLICNAILYANDKILERYSTFSAMATITTVVISPEENIFVMANVGDSPGYHFHRNKYDICTKSDIRAQARIENGKTVIKDGMPVIDNALTAALGTHVNLNPNIHKKLYEDGDIIIISTDGIDKRCITEFFEKYRFLKQKGIDDLVSLCAQRSNDDSTIVLITLGEIRVVKDLKEKVRFYHKLSNSEKEKLLKQMLPHWDKLYDELLFCYSSENNEKYQVEIFNRIYKAMDKKKFIFLADEAAKSHKRKLLDTIIDKINTHF